MGICADASDPERKTLIVSDEENHTIFVAKGSDISTLAKFDRPSGVATDKDGNVYVADRTNHLISKIERKTGAISTYAGLILSQPLRKNGPALEAGFVSPTCICIDSRRNRMFIGEDGAIRSINMDQQRSQPTIHPALACL